VNEILANTFIPMDRGYLWGIEALATAGLVLFWLLMARYRQPLLGWMGDRNADLAYSLIITIAVAVAVPFDVLTLSALYLAHPGEILHNYMTQIVLNLLWSALEAASHAKKFSEIVVDFIAAFIGPLLMYVAPLLAAPFVFRFPLVKDPFDFTRTEGWTWAAVGVAFVIACFGIHTMNAIVVFDAIGAGLAVSAIISKRLEVVPVHPTRHPAA